MNVAIIGGGPSGFYAAIKLWMKGVRDIKIFEPRLDNYVRPGHINDSVFVRAESGIGQKLRTSTRTAHIKDIERELCKYARSLGIPIEKASFVRFSDEKKGIIIAQENGEERFVNCDYALDCTGSKRVLVHAVNQRAISKKQPEPFKISPVSNDVTVKNHLLAYVKMTPQDVFAVENIPDSSNYGLYGKSPLYFAESIERLRQFGWRELAFPRCYKMRFGKDKACFYLEAPDNLPAEKKEEWFQTVLECTTGDSSISYQLLPDSKKYKYKPRVVTFPVDPQQLNRFSYQEKGLPCVITQGDAQIEPNYYLAHGIEESFERIDAMIDGLTIFERKIVYFDEQDYEHDVHKALVRHQKAVIKHYRNRKEYFIQWLRDSEGYYEQAISKKSKPIFQERLKEIKARIAYHDALDILDAKIPNNSINVALFQPANLVSDLIKAKELLTKASTELSPMFSQERDDAKEKLARLPAYFKEAGNELYKKGKYDVALQAYQQALSLYSLPPVNQQEIINLQSNMLLTHRKLNHMEEVIEIAVEMFNGEEDIPDSIRKKALFNAITAGSEAITGLQTASPSSELQVQLIKLQELCLRNKDFIRAQLENLQGDLIKIHSCIRTVAGLQGIAKQRFAKGEFEPALSYFEEALLMAKNESNRDHNVELVLCSNMVLTHRKLCRPEEALFVAKKTLDVYSDPAFEVKKKILFNTFKAMEENIDSQKSNLNKATIREAVAFYVQHKDFIDNNLSNDLKDSLAKLKSVLGNSDSLQESGKNYFSAGKLELALAAYEDALLAQRCSSEVSTKGTLVPKINQEIIKIYSNILLIHRKLNHEKEAIKTAVEVLGSQEEIPDSMRKKILFNAIAVGAAAIDRVQDADLKLIIPQLYGLCLQNKEFIETNLGDSKAELIRIKSLLSDEIPLHELREIANYHFDKKDFSSALEFFERALLRVESEISSDQSSAALLQSNIVLTCRKLSMSEKALSAAKKALNSSTDDDIKTKKKILFNTFKAVGEKFDSQKMLQDKSFARMSATFYLQHKDFIDKHLSTDLKESIATIGAVISDNNSDLKEKGKELFAQGKYQLALATYEDALLVHRLSGAADNEIVASLIGNLVLLYRKLECITQALPLADDILNSNQQVPVDAKKKILFNLVKGVVEATEKMRISASGSKMMEFVQEVSTIYLSHRDFMGKELAGSLKSELKMMDALIESTIESQSLFSFNQIKS